MNKTAMRPNYNLPEDRIISLMIRGMELDSEGEDHACLLGLDMAMLYATFAPEFWAELMAGCSKPDFDPEDMRFATQRMAERLVEERKP